MGDVRSSVFACGTEQPAAIARPLAAGALTLDIEDGALRDIRWHGVEIVRGVNCLVRDAHWGTFPAEQPKERFEKRDDGFSYERRFTVAEGRVQVVFTAEAGAGRLDVAAELAASTPLLTNRAGLTLLHPIRGVAGAPLTIRHSDGGREHGAFPALVQPSQPAFDIVGLEHVVDGVAVAIDFAGEIFEMEDQRNWTDASFKTYCRPLALPTPYAIEPGTTIRQSITIRCSGMPDGRAASDAGPVRLGGEAGRLPAILLAIDADEPVDVAAAALLDAAGLDRVSLRLGTGITSERLAALAPLIAGRAVEIEAIIPDGDAPHAALAALRAALDASAIAPERVLALPAAYLASHQPSGPWPSGATPADAARAARALFPGAGIGGGMLTSFTEFNRCRPDPAQVDSVGHGTTAIVHAADDRSVMETLQTLPAIFASAAAIAAGKPYRLGLVSIGMRSNAYGPERAADPAGRRLAMAKVDPRQRGLFAAAFAVGAVAATAGSTVEALALAAPTGPFGMIRTATAWPQPYYDDHPDARVHPLFHVVRALARLQGAARREIGPLPEGIAGIAAGRSAILANLGAAPATLRLAEAAGIRLLDAASFGDAAVDPAWLDGPRPSVRELTLGAYALAFLTFAGDLP